MEEKEMVTVPYFVYEGAEVKHERTVKRLIIALILCIVLMFASNAIWLYAWMQYDYEDVVQEVDLRTSGDGDASFIGRDFNLGVNDGTGEGDYTK